MGTKADFDKRCEFVHLLIDTLQSYGVSSRSMELMLKDIVESLGLFGDFNVTPRFVQAVIWSQDREHQWVYLIVSRSGDFDLAKLHKVIEVVDGLDSDSFDVNAGVKKLQEIIAKPKIYGPAITALAFVMSSAGFGPLIGASIRDSILGGAISLAPFALSIVAKSSQRVGALLEFFAAFVAIVLARSAALFIPGADFVPVATIAVIVFIPGFGLTLAPRELIFGNSLSGLLWMTNALVIAFKLFLGLAIGTFVMNYFLGEPAIVKSPDISFLTKFAGVTLFLIGFAIILRVEAVYLLAVIVSGWATWGVVQYGNEISFWFGTFLGTITIIAVSSWFARFFRVPSVVIALPCVMILLPGLAAMNAMKSFATDGAIDGFRATYPVMVLIISLIAGSLIGDALGSESVVKTGKVMRRLVGLDALERRVKRKGKAHLN